MTPDDPGAQAAELTELHQRIAYLQEALTAITSGEVDGVVMGEQEQVYSLNGADRPYRVIVESMGEGAATVSECGVILFANSQLASFLGVERDSMIGRDITSYVEEEHQPALASLLGPRATETRRAELTLAKTDGAEVPLIVAATDLDIDGELVRCLVLTDLTMRKRVERQSVEEAAQGERHRVAREVNDTIVQGLVTAEMALDLGQVERARNVIARTSSRARTWIGDLAGDQPLTAGMAVRAFPAESATENS